MKQIITLSIFCLGFLAVNAQDHDGHSHGTTAKTAAPANPAEDFLKVQTEHDFGKIPQGKPVTYVFEVTNTGKSPFKLDNVQAACGCTTPVWDKETPIPVGGTAKITVGYNAAAEGVFSKPITITYNTNQTKQLTIKGEVWKTPAESAPTNAGVNELKN